MEGATSAPYEGGGAGGKFRKRPFRKPAATPYDRPPPPPEASVRPRDGWLSRFADPASRLLASGAARLFPSIFSKTLPDTSITDHQSSDELPKDSCLEKKQEASNKLPKDSCLSQVSESGEQRSHCEADGQKSGSDNDEIDGDKLSNSYDGSEFVEIEQLFKQKTFSRDEFNHLAEILRSRTTDLPDDIRKGKTSPNMVALAEAADDALQQGNLRKSVEEKQAEQLDNEVMGRTAVPPIKSTVRKQIYDEVGASPVDIAKAFMGARTSALNLSSQSVLLEDERLPQYSDVFASSSSIPLTPLKSPTCWPGAMVQEVPGYLTPQTQRGRIRLHDLPRTPHRGVLSRSISRGIGERPFNLPSSRSKQQHTPIFGASQVRNSYVLDDGFTSGRPLHRIRQKSMETPTSKGAGSSHSASPGLLPSSGTDAFEGFLSTIPENLDTIPSKRSSTKLHPTENKAHGYSVSSSTVHPHSSVMARRILEHLDRTVPSPTEKANELKLAVLGQKPPPEVSAGMLNGQRSQADIAPGSLISSHLLFQDRCAQGNGNTGKVIPHIEDEDTKKDKAGCSRNTGISASNTFANRHEVSAELTHKKHGNKNWLLSTHNQIDEKGIPGVVCSAACSDALQIPKPQSHSFGNKPALTSISIMKPNGKHAISHDNGFGFTFPVSAASVSLSEPPTPTMMPSLVSKTTEPKEGTTIPSFNFGSSNAANGPVFSFPNSVSSSVGDASIPKFNFGLEKKTKVSFRSVGKDAICF